MREQEKVSGTCQGRFWYSGGTAGVVGRGRGHRLPIRRLDLTESKVRELILELQPDFVLFQQLPALVPDVQQYDLIPANTISHSGTIEKEKVRGVRNLIGGLDKPRLRNPSNHLAGDTLFDLLFGDFSKFSTFDLEHKSSDLIFVRHKRTHRHTLDPSGGSASEMCLGRLSVLRAT